jgi:hypothetical protein
VYLQIGVQSQTITTVPTYANLSGMYGKLALYNALDDSCTLLTTPQMAALMAVTLPASSVGSNWIWQGKIGDGTVAGYRAMSTAQVSAVMSGTAPTGGSNHGIVVGNWKYMVIGDYGMELVLDTATMAAQGCVRYVAIGMADIVLLHPEAFCVSSAATIS